MRALRLLLGPAAVLASGLGFAAPGAAAAGATEPTPLPEPLVVVVDTPAPEPVSSDPAYSPTPAQVTVSAEAVEPSEPAAPAGGSVSEDDTPAPKRGLPVTGAQVGGMVVLGGGMIAAGLVMLTVRRRDLTRLLEGADS